ncbi:hypothetical protein AVEN_110057-1, partial [Araneus ventricosus]
SILLTGKAKSLNWTIFQGTPDGVGMVAGCLSKNELALFVWSRCPSTV